MTLAIGPKRALAILLKHGLDPDADIESLTEVIEARGRHIAGFAVVGDAGG